MCAYLDKLSHFPPLKKHNTEKLISFSATISALVRVFWSLHYHQNLSAASFLGQATRSFPKSWKKHGLCIPRWRIKVVRYYSNSKTGWRTKQRRLRAWNCLQENRKLKTATLLLMYSERRPERIFLHEPDSFRHEEWETKPTIDHWLFCLYRKLSLVALSAVPQKDAYPTAKLFHTIYYVFHASMGKIHSAKNPRLRKSSNQGCSCGHNTVLHGSKRNFPQKNLKNTEETKETTASNVSVVMNKTEESTGMPSVLKKNSRLHTPFCKHPFELRKFLSSVILPAVTRGCPSIWLEIWKFKIHLWNLRFTDLTPIKSLARKRSSWCWHRFIGEVLSHFLWSSRMWGKN